MSLVYPTKIFQYIPTLKPSSYIKKNANSWLNRVHDQVEEKTNKVKDIVQSVNIRERNSIDETPINSLPTNIEKTEKSPEIRGLEQHAKDVTIKIENDKNKIDELVRKSNRSIMNISTIFPWNFFPNTIDVEESRVTFIFRQLFASQSYSVDIKDISNVFIESGFFSATLHVVSRTFNQNNIKIEYLRKHEAAKTRDVIEGLRTFAYHDINTSNYEIDELKGKLKELRTSKIS